MALSCSKCGRQANGEHFVAFDLCRVCDDAEHAAEKVKAQYEAKSAADAAERRKVMVDEARALLREVAAAEGGGVSA